MASTPALIGMRDAYFDALYPLFQEDKDCVIITADNGAPSLDKFHGLKNQFYQVGIAEQQMFGMAAGLALEGKRVWVYAIAPFVTTRVHEFVKLDVCATNFPITILGVGAGFAYDNMGPSHHTLEDISIMRVYPNLEIWSPSDSRSAALLAARSQKSRQPTYIRFDRTGLPEIHDEESAAWAVSDGAYMFESGKEPDVLILTTGVMVNQALSMVPDLFMRGIDAWVVDVQRIKPLAAELFLNLAPEGLAFVTLEEHYLPGGLGSIVAECLVDAGLSNRLLRIGMPAEFCFTYGGRQAIWEKYGLDKESVLERISTWWHKK